MERVPELENTAAMPASTKMLPGTKILPACTKIVTATTKIVSSSTNIVPASTNATEYYARVSPTSTEYTKVVLRDDGEVTMRPAVMIKPRKTNFTPKEVEVLLTAVAKRRETVLFGVAGGLVWAQAWQDVANEVCAVEGICRSESDVRKKWTYLKWEAKNTSKPDRDPTSRAVLEILTARDPEKSARAKALLEEVLESECKKRWKYVRDSYNRCKRKRKMQMGSAAPAKHSKWEFFERLQFLERISSERVTLSNISLDSIVTTPTASGERNTQPQDTEGTSNVTVDPIKTSSGQPPTKKRRKVQDDFLDYLKKRDENRQMLFEELSAVKVTEIDDDINSFGNHVKSVLRKLNPRCKLQAKTEIFSVLTKYEMIQMDMECGVQMTSGMSSENV